MIAKNKLQRIVEHHEAGHAFAARWQGLPVAYVSTLEGGAEARAGSATHLACDADQATQLAAIRKDMIVCFAGPHGQAKYSRPKRRNAEEWGDDMQNATALAARAALIVDGIDARQIDPDVPVTLDDKQDEYAKDLMQQCSDEARRLVDEHWPTIVKIAEALSTRPILDEHDLDELIGRAR